MNEPTIATDKLKQAVKEALIETLNEKRDLLRGIMAEALEDFALVEAIKEGEQTELVSRESVFNLLEGRT
jgi:hypothetical protein